MGSFFLSLSILMAWAVVKQCELILRSIGFNKYFIFGALLFLLLSRIQYRFIKDNIELLKVFSHEFTHLIFCLLSFKRIEKIEASKNQGGQVQFHGNGNIFIFLSPYCIPIFTIFFILIKQLAAQRFEYVFDLLIGFSYIFHLHTFISQCKSNQPDIKKYGLFSSLSFIIFFNFLFLLVVLTENHSGISSIKTIFMSMFNIIKGIF